MEEEEEEAVVETAAAAAAAAAEEEEEEEEKDFLFALSRRSRKSCCRGEGGRWVKVMRIVWNIAFYIHF